MEQNIGFIFLIENLSVNHKNLNQESLKLLKSCIEDDETVNKIFKCKIISNVIQKYDKNKLMNNHLTTILESLNKYSIYNFIIQDA